MGLLGLLYSQTQPRNVWETHKIIKSARNRVHMARFGLIIAQNRSHRLWGASGMPPGPPNRPTKIKNPGFSGFRGLGGQGPLFPLLALKGCGQKVNNPMQRLQGYACQFPSIFVGGLKSYCTGLRHRGWPLGPQRGEIQPTKWPLGPPRVPHGPLGGEGGDPPLI